MVDDNSADRIDKMKQMEGGPGVDDVLEVYSNNSGYSSEPDVSKELTGEADIRTSYSDSSD